MKVLTRNKLETIIKRDWGVCVLAQMNEDGWGERRWGAGSRW